MLIPSHIHPKRDDATVRHKLISMYKIPPYNSSVNRSQVILKLVFALIKVDFFHQVVYSVYLITLSLFASVFIYIGLIGGIKPTGHIIYVSQAFRRSEP